MPNIKVQPQNTLKVTVGPTPATKVISAQIASSSSSNLRNLLDVDDTGLQDNFVLQYDAASQKFKFVDPDQVLSDAVPGGIPGEFINVLDTDTSRVDNIDFDGGNF
ncbi:hypothetical protein [Synechococcus phage DSL-LC02]|nr:hypothetical protein [Synechococcus phage DSL-LC02]